MMTITTFEQLSVELFYERFLYFHLHEAFAMFSILNSRLTAIINNIPLKPITLDLNGMSLSLAEFYHRYLVQPNVSNRVLSLCVTDTSSIDNGLRLNTYSFSLINLRYLSLINIKRFSFELILSLFSLNPSLIRFSLDFPIYSRAAYTYEGAYYERIFQLFPFVTSM